MLRVAKLSPVILIAGLAACQNHVPVGTETQFHLTGAKAANCTADGAGQPVDFKVPGAAVLPPADPVTGQVTIACFQKGRFPATAQADFHFGAPRAVTIAMQKTPDVARKAHRKNRFTLFFDESQSNWIKGKKSQTMLDKAVAKFLEAGPSRFVIAAHADEQGLYRANDRLAEKRGQKVKAELQARGVPGNLISVDGFSEHYPALAIGRSGGGDRRLAANRRVVIRVIPLAMDGMARGHGPHHHGHDLDGHWHSFSHRFSECKSGC